jgi:hypothetical protein
MDLVKKDLLSRYHRFRFGVRTLHGIPSLANVRKKAHVDLIGRSRSSLFLFLWYLLLLLFENNRVEIHGFYHFKTNNQTTTAFVVPIVQSNSRWKRLGNGLLSIRCVERRTPCQEH